MDQQRDVIIFEEFKMLVKIDLILLQTYISTATIVQIVDSQVFNSYKSSDS